MVYKKHGGFAGIMNGKPAFLLHLDLNARVLLHGIGNVLSVKLKQNQ